MALSSDVLRGHTDTIILRILSEGDSYGYEIAKKIIDAGEGVIDIKDATIYTAFKRMEAEGLLTTYWGDGIGGARRKYYRITQKGQQYYDEKLAQWKLIDKILNNLITGGN
ncbi:MAG TPA: PadR family transcriptional regulator [Candidatus Stercoripulliclostridium merdipullorum]|uniref:PadR family transcriptional regulator n=1 Tax=Candidatus Stercoripulliclostridium merdipullorum TaxID=2840952 RepID=A0A9D1SY87_9FIRM|nr:PadR family transcriptional regulator [Candidatus Stercoripulliclostridium merdipullorum]